MSSQQPFNTANGANANGAFQGNAGSANGSGNGGKEASGGATEAELGLVRHAEFLSEHIGALYLDDEYSDVQLQVQGETFCAHRYTYRGTH